jgi:hypothetical protein
LFPKDAFVLERKYFTGVLAEIIGTLKDSGWDLGFWGLGCYGIGDDIG